MNVTDEIKTLQTVVEALTPLDPAGRQRVVNYACSMLNITEGPQDLVSGDLDKTPHGAKTSSSVGAGKPKAAQQYLREYNYKMMTKRIAVMAVYLEREQGKKRFDLKDISEAFRSAKESKLPAYSQYSRSIIMGYLAKEGDRLYATSKAEELVDGYGKNSSGGEHDRKDS